MSSPAFTSSAQLHALAQAEAQAQAKASLQSRTFSPAAFSLSGNASAAPNFVLPPPHPSAAGSTQHPVNPSLPPRPSHSSTHDAPLAPGSTVQQFSLPIDIALPQQTAAYARTGPQSLSAHTVPGIKLHVRVIDSMHSAEMPAQLQWLQVDEAMAVYSLSPYLALCSNTRCLIISSTSLGSNGPALSPPASPRSSARSSASHNDHSSSSASTSSSRGKTSALHSALAKLFALPSVIKMGVDVISLLAEVYQQDALAAVSFLELQSMPTALGATASLSSLSSALDPLDTVLQLLTSEASADAAGSSHLQHALAARAFRLLCLGLRVVQPAPLYSLPQLSSAQLAAMLESPDAFTWPAPLDDTCMMDPLQLARTRQRMRMALTHVHASLAQVLSPNSTAASSSSTLGASSSIFHSPFVGSGTVSPHSNGPTSPFLSGFGSPTLSSASAFGSTLGLTSGSSPQSLFGSMPTSPSFGPIGSNTASGASTPSRRVVEKGARPPGFGGSTASSGASSVRTGFTANGASMGGTAASSPSLGAMDPSLAVAALSLSMMNLAPEVSAPLLSALANQQSSSQNELSSLIQSLSLATGASTSAAVAMDALGSKEWSSSQDWARVAESQRRHSNADAHDQSGSWMAASPVRSGSSSLPSASPLHQPLPAPILFAADQQKLLQLYLQQSQQHQPQSLSAPVTRMPSNLSSPVGASSFTPLSGGSTPAEGSLPLSADALPSSVRTMLVQFMNTLASTSIAEVEALDPQLAQALAQARASVAALGGLEALNAANEQQHNASSSLSHEVVANPATAAALQVLASSLDLISQAMSRSALASLNQPPSPMLSAQPMPHQSVRPMMSQSMPTSGARTPSASSPSLSSSLGVVGQQRRAVGPTSGPAGAAAHASASGRSSGSATPINAPPGTPTARALFGAAPPSPQAAPLPPPASASSSQQPSSKTVSYAALAASAASASRAVGAASSAASSKPKPAGQQQQQQRRHRDMAKASELDRMLYKTAMCKRFQETGFCAYADECGFAHGDGELRKLSAAERASLAALTRKERSKKEKAAAAAAAGGESADSADSPSSSADEIDESDESKASKPARHHARRNDKRGGGGVSSFSSSSSSSSSSGGK